MTATAPTLTDRLNDLRRERGLAPVVPRFRSVQRAEFGEFVDAPADRPASPGSPDALAAAISIKKLREGRAVPKTDRSLRSIFFDQGRWFTKLARRTGGVGRVWSERCPPEFLEFTRVVSLDPKNGTLTIAVSDSAVMFELDRALRAGLEAQLIKASSAPISKVRLVPEGSTK